MERAILYLEKNHIVETLQEITWRIFYYQPEDPLAYLSGYFQVLMQQEQQQHQEGQTQ